MTVYFISGTAADEKIFENLTLPSHLIIKNVHWIEPLKKESFFNYCKRLSEQIKVSDDFALIGVSLGGMVSIELNKILKPKQTIIISSVATRHELSPLFRFFNLIKLHKILPASFYKWYNPFISWYFGVQTKREEGLLRCYMKSASGNYMRWAVYEVLNWKNEERLSSLFHIHGTAYRIFTH